MKKLLIMLMLCIAGFGTVSAQNEAYRKEVMKMYNKTMMGDQLEQMLYQELKPTVSSMMTDAKIQDMCHELTIALSPDIINAMEKACREIYTLEDMTIINNFYDTPTGQKMAKNMAKMQDIISKSLESPATMNKLQEIIMKYML